MPSILLSDNGVSSGSAGLKSTAASDGVLVLQTTTSGGTATNAVYVDNTQDVGIGTNAPVANTRLHVHESANTISRIRLTNSTTTDASGRGLGVFQNGLETYITNNEAGAMVLSTSGTERMRINSGAPILCLSGGNTSATGTGISFPATQSASTDANTLDDYEEGTWTPALTASSSGSPTINSYSASYVKVGRLVQIVLNMSVTKSTAAGYMAITGLPFTVESGYYPQSAMLTDLCSSQYSNPVVQFASNGTSCYPIVNNGSTTTHDQIQWSQWSSTQFTFRLTTTYRSAS